MFDTQLWHRHDLGCQQCGVSFEALFSFCGFAFLSMTQRHVGKSRVIALITVYMKK